MPRNLRCPRHGARGYKKRNQTDWLANGPHLWSSGGTPSPPIIVKFTQRDTRDRFYRLRSKLKDFSTGNIGLGRVAENKIFIQESLTPKKKDLFRNCLEFKKRKSFKFIYYQRPGKATSTAWISCSRYIHFRNECTE